MANKKHSYRHFYQIGVLLESLAASITLVIGIKQTPDSGGVECLISKLKSVHKKEKFVSKLIILYITISFKQNELTIYIKKNLPQS